MTVVNMDTEQLEVVKAFQQFAAPCDFEQNASSSSHLSIMAVQRFTGSELVLVKFILARISYIFNY